VRHRSDLLDEDPRRLAGSAADSRARHEAGGEMTDEELEDRIRLLDAALGRPMLEWKSA
jgi:hypothetical protein